MTQPLRDRHDIVFSLERVPGCDHLPRGRRRCMPTGWRTGRRFHPVKGRVRTLLRAKNRELCRLEAQVFAPGGVRRVICNSHFVAEPDHRSVSLFRRSGST